MVTTPRRRGAAVPSAAIPASPSAAGLGNSLQRAGNAFGAAGLNLAKEIFRRERKEALALAEKAGREAGQADFTEIKVGDTVVNVPTFTPVANPDNRDQQELINQAGLKALGDRIDTAVITTLERLERDNFGKPEAFRAMTEQFERGFTNALPDEAKAHAREVIARLSQRPLRKLEAQRAAESLDRQVADLNTAIRDSQIELEKIGQDLASPDQTTREAAMSERAALFTRLTERLARRDLNGRPFFSAQAQDKVLNDLNVGLATNIAIERFNQAQDKRRFMRDFDPDPDNEFTPAEQNKIRAAVRAEFANFNATRAADRIELGQRFTELNRAIISGAARGAVPQETAAIMARGRIAGMDRQVARTQRLLDLSSRIREFSMSDAQTQAREINRLQSVQRPSLDQVALLDSYRSIVANRIRLKNDRLTYAQSMNLLDGGTSTSKGLEPLDPTAPGSLRRRERQAQKVKAMTGASDLQVMTRPEVLNLMEAARTGSPEIVTQWIAYLSTASPEGRAAIVRQVAAEKKMPGLAGAITIAEHDPTTARDIIFGMRQLQADQGARLTPTDIETFEKESKLRSIYGTNAAAFQEMKAVALALAAKMLTDQGSPGDAATKRNVAVDAFNRVAGGEPFRFKGSEYLMPARPGFTDDDLGRLVGVLNERDMVQFSGGRVAIDPQTGRVLTPKDIRRGFARFRQHNPGFYMLVDRDNNPFPSAPAPEAGVKPEAENRPFVLDVGGMFDEGINTRSSGPGRVDIELRPR